MKYEWIQLASDPSKWIERSTLTELAMLLDDAPAAAPPAAVVATDSGAVASVDVAGVPNLADVGGTALVAPETGAPVAVARIGRNSFVGYTLEPELGELAEVPVTFDQASGRIIIPVRPG